MDEASGATSAAAAAADAVMRRLEKGGWSLVESDDVVALIAIRRALADDPCDDDAVADAVESELLNTDLRSVGAKSLPDPSSLRNLTHLIGPKILQVSEVRDISRSSIADGTTDSSRIRMLRFGLTDGHSQVTAVEYNRIASIDGDVVPGTKVRLERKVPMHDGILCLNPTALTVLGGIVQSLHEEWHVNKKCSSLSRESLRTNHQDGVDGPPPFEKLQIGQLSRLPAEWAKCQQYSKSTSRAYGYDRGQHSGTMKNRSDAGFETLEAKQDMKDKGVGNSSSTRPEENQSNPEARPKEVAEAAPIQNQAAAKKLLQKMSQPVERNSHSRGRKSRGRARQEEASVFTLDEWEQRNSAAKPAFEEEVADTTRDEELARQLQNQLDLDAHEVDVHETEAEKIRRSMFGYGGEYEGVDSSGRGRGRGQGQGRGRGKGRGKGKGRGGGRGRGAFRGGRRHG